jgi:hypothetical protein
MALIEVNWRPAPKTLRGFGLIALVAFAALGAWAFFGQELFGVELGPDAARTAAWALGAVAALCGALALAAPRALRPLYVVLTAISLPIGFVVSHVIMALLYFGVFAPVALFFRVLRRDALNRRFERSRQSYWVEREAVTDRARYFRQH